MRQQGQARYKRSPKEDRTWDGRVFDSKHEMNTAIKLQALEKSGKITDLQYQVPFVLVPKDGKLREITYRADFTFREGGCLQVVDAKGHKTQLYILKKRLVRHLHGIEIQEV
jgi:hypothetical protein